LSKAQRFCDLPNDHSYCFNRLNPMPGDFSDYIPISRTFRDLSSEDLADVDKASQLVRHGWAGGVDWDDILRSPRILLISEAGAGKTRECQAQKDRLLAAGEPAFFFDLATLANITPRETLPPDEETRFDTWLSSQSDVATFFLDSVDELKLTLGNFGLALTRFAKALGGQIARARIVVTSRPVPFDRALIERLLPIPSPFESLPTAEGFADLMMECRNNSDAVEDSKRPKSWRNVGLMPLSQEQRRQFAIGQGVSDPDAMLADIRSRDAEEFAERPQDLIELCADWRDHHRIRFHRDQVETDIANKLKPRTDRQERADLTQEKAIEGASRLALAAMLTRKLTLRYNAESDRVTATEPALDVSKVLLDWDSKAQATLLERPLFGFASYGRVRFHHRSVVEFLAAKRLHALLVRGAPVKAIKRLLFTETAQGLKVVRPSMRPVAAWMASWHATIFDDIVRLGPAVALDHGDPQSLSTSQRTRALEAYVERYGSGGWRGLQAPSIQVHRFAAPELASVVERLWKGSIENEEVRELLLRLIVAGKLEGCADLVFGVAMSGVGARYERVLAIEALIQLADARLGGMSASIVNDANLWPPEVARKAMLRLFPKYMPINHLKCILTRVPDDRGSLGDYDYYLREEIAHGEFEPDYLDALRIALTKIVRDGLVWDKDAHPHIRTRRPDIVAPLTAACCRQATQGVSTPDWVRSSLLAVRLSDREYSEDKPSTHLRCAISQLSAEAREAGFWDEVNLHESLHPENDAYHRLWQITNDKGIEFDDAKDAAWVRRRLSDPAEPIKHREMMLWAEMVFLNRDCADHRALLNELRAHVVDTPELTEIVDKRLEAQSDDPKYRQWAKRNAAHKRKRARDQAKAHASWVAFWEEIVRDPGSVFAADRADNTTRNLWQAMERSGRESRASGWDRQLIERQFGKIVADRLRQTMMAGWRKDRPTLTSERPEGERNYVLIRWQLGLAGITAEAEDQQWAEKLMEKEVALACRYAPVHLNGFPAWLESLAIKHPSVVDQVLGAELSLSLQRVAQGHGYSMTLQDVSYAPPILAALFVPRIRAWLAGLDLSSPTDEQSQLEHHVQQAIEILIKSGSDDDRRFIETEALRHLSSSGLSRVSWLSALLHLNPPAGVQALERRLEGAAISKYGSGVELFASLFGRDRIKDIDLGGVGFVPPLLLRLLRLAYRHVGKEDDAQHEGAYRPDTRDDAEQARNAILGALLASTGAEGWKAKIELASDPLFSHFKDRALAIATEKIAEEADASPLNEAEFAVLDKIGEAPPTTRDAMFALMRDRLDDLDDLLLQDISPRELWAAIKDERVMRRELARTLRDWSRDIYTVDQEAVTADEKETDIRLRSTISSQQATVELKLADDRSGRDLLDTLRKQLLEKYMAADDCRAGCLLVTISREREWQHPHTGKNVDFAQLVTVLNEEAEAISRELGGTAKIMAKGLNLRPRLT
jgi:hypothetical protein